MNFLTCIQFLIGFFGEIIFSPCPSVPLAYEVENFQEEKLWDNTSRVFPPTRIRDFSDPHAAANGAYPPRPLHVTSPLVRDRAPFYRQLWRPPSFCVSIIGSYHGQVCLLSWVVGAGGIMGRCVCPSHGWWEYGVPRS